MTDLCVVLGAGNAYAGAGDPFHPFRQILGLLCGDLERAWTQGTLTRDEATELWADLPATVGTVLADGPYLIGTLIDASALGRRFEDGFPDHPLGPELATVVQVALRRVDDPMRQQRPILDQCARVLGHLAGRRPMLLLVDDLHWADLGTIELVRHLAGQVRGVPLLLIGTYRPAASAPSAEVDPVALMVHEVRAHADDEVLLELSGDRRFIDDWLDNEPNLLDEDFRQRLYRTTGGHALFTVETVAAMRRRGDLVRDEAGRWTASDPIAWETLPPRVEATIAARVMQLPEQVRRDLEVASVQGVGFVGEVTAAVRQVEPADVLLRLGGLAAPPHALVETLGVERIDGRRLVRCRFRHALIRQYLYEGLSTPDRVALHEATGRALAAVRADRIDEVAVDLALHLDEAGCVDEAVEHHALAGRRALRLAAMQAARHHLERAVELVRGLPPSADRDRRELALLTPLGASLQALAGYNVTATDEVYERIRELIGVVGPTFESAQALGALTGLDGLRARYGDAIAGSRRLLEIARQLDLAPIEAVAHMQLGWLLLMSGHLDEAMVQLDRTIDMYDEEWDDWLTFAIGAHVSSTALAWRGWTNWFLGRPDRARSDGLDAIDAARRSGSPFALTFALAVGGCATFDSLREYRATVDFAREELDTAEREDFAFYSAAALVHRGLGRSKCGDREDGLRDVELGLARWAQSGTEAFRCTLTALYAERLVDAGRLDRAEAAIGEVERRLATGEEQLVAHLVPIVRASLARARGDDAGAEAELRRGIALHERHGAHGPRLRSAVHLAELLCDHDRPEEARAALEPILTRFGEDANDLDVSDARAVLARTTG